MMSKSHGKQAQPGWQVAQAEFERTAVVVRDYILEITFSDHSTAKLDFTKHIVGRGGVFRSLENVATFRQVCVDEEAGTLVWPNDVDFCPDVLYSEALGVSLPVPTVV
jgi:hypothetical protein